MVYNIVYTSVAIVLAVARCMARFMTLGDRLSVNKHAH